MAVFSIENEPLVTERWFSSTCALMKGRGAALPINHTRTDRVDNWDPHRGWLHGQFDLDLPMRSSVQYGVSSGLAPAVLVRCLPRLSP
jgi:hypothetical protein